MHPLYGTERSPGSSLIHRCDVRTKMTISLLASVAVIFFDSWQALTFLTAISTIYVMNIGRIRLVLLCYTALMLMWGVSVFFLYLLSHLHDLFRLSGTERLLPPFLRTMVMLNVVLALALSSNIQALLAALKGLRLPFCLYIPAAVVIRFIPSFIQDVRQVHETMKTRGYSLNLFFVLRHLRLTTRLLIAPMLFRALKSADELSVAAELKGMNPQVKIRPYHATKLSRLDGMIFSLAAASMAVAAAIQVTWPNTGGGGMM